MCRSVAFIMKTTVPVALCALALLSFPPPSTAHVSSPQGHQHADETSEIVETNSVTLSTAAYEVPVDSTFTVELGIDFDDLFLGGSLHLAYDLDLVELVSFSFSTAGPQPIIADFTQSPSGAFVSWGWFEDEPNFSVSGMHSIGTLTLLAKTEGLSGVFSAGVAISSAAGPMSGPGHESTPLQGSSLYVIYGETYFAIVPEPNTAVLVLVGLILLQALYYPPGNPNRPG